MRRLPAVGITYRASAVRTPDGVLHVVYPHDLSGGGTTIGHTALDSNGSIARQNNVLATGWATMDVSPIVVSGGASSLRTLFVGRLDLGAGFWSQDWMYDATSATSGASWTLPAEELGSDSPLSGLYGMGATTLANGTPVAATPLNDTLRWHVGVGTDADLTHSVAGTSMFDVSLVRSGSTVWASWYQDGNTAATNGVFVMPIYPTPGPATRAPGSSSGAHGISLGRTALAARVGGGVFLAYCVPSPSTVCTKIRLWKVGTTQTTDVPGTRYAQRVSLSPGPSGRLWLAWADNTPRIRAVRTGTTGMRLGAVVNAGIPRGHPAAYQLLVDGTRGRGDLVLNVGDGFWHTQVLAGLTLHASPRSWRHGSRQRVGFTVTDAGAAIGRATVKVGTLSCRTSTRGTCSITFPRSFYRGRHTASASRSGYTKATTTLRVR